MIKYPKDGSIWQTLGTALQRLGRLDDSIEAKIKGVQFSPNDAIALFNLGNSFRDLGRFEEAEDSYKKALKINPKLKRAYYCLGLVLVSLKRVDEAENCYQQEILINPNLPDVHYALGNIQREKGNLSAAETSYKQVIKINPNFSGSYNNLGIVSSKQMKLKEAAYYFRHVLKINSNNRNAYSNLLFCLNHCDENTQETYINEAKAYGEFVSKQITPYAHSFTNQNPKKRLKIGFVTGDFYDHATSRFIQSLLPHINKKHIQLFAYYNNNKNDNITKYFKQYFTEWREVIACSDSEIATKIKADEIDIAIDMSGHTSNNRLLVFAYKPAPIQLSWIAYPASTGLKTMDYYLVDSDWAPEGLLDDYFVEKLVRLPSVVDFKITTSDAIVTDGPAKKNGYITFGSFNRSSKLTKATLDLWCRVLNEIPESKMFLGSLPDEASKQKLAHDFSSRGVHIDRLIFHLRTSTEKAYLELHSEIDLMLDTFPYAGMTVTGSALWMGVPTLTYAWKSLAGRGGVAMLGRVDLKDDFVADTPEQFVKMAKTWSSNISDLQILRHQLRDRMKYSTKCRSENIAAGLERAFRIMWERFCENAPVESFDV